MTAFRTSRNNPISLPYEGMDLQTPLSNLPVTRAPWIENFFIDGQTFKGRNGTQVLSFITGGTGNIASQITYSNSVSGAQTIFAAETVGGDIYNMTTNPATSVLSGLSLDPSALFVGFKSYLYLLGSGMAPKTYNGSTWGAFGFTGGPALSLCCGNPYRNRMYFVEDFSTNVYYGGVNSVSGALTVFDVGSLFTKGGKLFNVYPVSFGSDNESAKFLAFMSSEGEVVYYAGASPEASDWRLVATLKVGKPLLREAFVFYQGDTLVVTNTGLVSLRDLLLTNNSNDIYIPLSYAIDPYWRRLCSALDAGGVAEGNVSICFLDRTGCIYIYFVNSLSRTDNLISNTLSTTPIIFVYNTITKSWTNNQYPISDLTGNLVEYDNQLVGSFEGASPSATIGAITLEKENIYQDQKPGDLSFSSITANILSSAFITPQSGGVVKNDSISLFGYVGASSQSVLCNLIENFGTGSTPNSRPKVIINSFNRLPISLGSVAPYVQYNLNVSSKSDSGQPTTLYAINVLNESGGFG